MTEIRLFLELRGLHEFIVLESNNDSSMTPNRNGHNERGLETARGILAYLKMVLRLLGVLLRRRLEVFHSFREERRENPIDSPLVVAAWETKDRSNQTTDKGRHDSNHGTNVKVEIVQCDVMVEVVLVSAYSCVSISLGISQKGYQQRGSPTVKRLEA